MLVMHHKDNPKDARKQKDGRYLNNAYIWTILYIKVWMNIERDDSIMLPHSRQIHNILLLLSWWDSLSVVSMMIEVVMKCHERIFDSSLWKIWWEVL